MLCQGLSLIVAALIHFGVLMTGYEHRRAGTAETVIGVVLLGALTLWRRPRPLPISRLATARRLHNGMRRLTDWG
jgi:hypothetical protein